MFMLGFPRSVHQGPCWGACAQLCFIQMKAWRLRSCMCGSSCSGDQQPSRCPLPSETGCVSYCCRPCPMQAPLSSSEVVSVRKTLFYSVRICTYVQFFQGWPCMLFLLLVSDLSGLLWLLVQLAEAVSVLMNCTDSQIMCHENQSIHTDSSQILSQNQEQQSLDCCHLPLILKQVSV